MSKFYYNEEQESYDAIVVGTGISGGWAAKELCENGLKTLHDFQVGVIGRWNNGTIENLGKGFIIIVILQDFFGQAIFKKGRRLDNRRSGRRRRRNRIDDGCTVHGSEFQQIGMTRAA